jgi:hypothetical protein
MSTINQSLSIFYLVRLSLTATQAKVQKGFRSQSIMNYVFSEIIGNSYILSKMNGEIELYLSAISISGSPSYLYRGRKL